MNPKIKEVKAITILDSRNKPTVETTIKTGTHEATASVPSGASTGIHEAHELRDQDGTVNTAVNNVNTILRKALIGKELNQEKLDNLIIKLDATKNKSRLGANAILSISLALAKLKAKTEDKPLYASIENCTTIPLPFMNIINGGRHAKNKLKFQEFMIVPKFKTFQESLERSKEVFKELKKIITRKYGPTPLGDEGGFAPKISSPEEALDLLQKTIDKLGYEHEIKFAMDVAASEFYKKGIPEGHYLINRKKLGPHKLTEIYEELLSNYPIISIEDPFNQENFNEWTEFTKEFGKKVQIVGDDLLVTNLEKIKKAMKAKACNALLLKVNQIGTLTEALQAATFALENKWHVMVSHRSGETMDTFIADLAVSIGTGQIKSGAPSRPERLAKYERLVEIEKQLGKKARYGL